MNPLGGANKSILKGSMKYIFQNNVRLSFGESAGAFSLK